jgi:hypothetical protein
MKEMEETKRALQQLKNSNAATTNPVIHKKQKSSSAGRSSGGSKLPTIVSDESEDSSPSTSPQQRGQSLSSTGGTYQAPHAIAIYVLVVSHQVDLDETDFYICPLNKLSSSDLRLLAELHGAGANEERLRAPYKSLLSNGYFQVMDKLTFGTNTDTIKINKYIKQVYQITFL